MKKMLITRIAAKKFLFWGRGHNKNPRYLPRLGKSISISVPSYIKSPCLIYKIENAGNNYFWLQSN